MTPARELIAIRARTMRARDGLHQSLTQTEADRAALIGDVYELLGALREELENLWSGFAAAYRYSQATPPERSGGCLHLAGRIAKVTRLVGPLPPEKIELPFLLTGMYERLHADMGIEAPPIPPALLQQAREYVAQSKRHVR